MANLKPKRPSSARRNIKQEMFSQSVSQSRLRSVQSHLVSSAESETLDKPDALLCVLGIDGRYNDGTRELVNYLLFGFFDVRKNELEKSGFAEEVIDDMMFVIRQQSVEVYCNPINYHYLLPYIAHWRNLHIHCVTDDKYEDDEFAEEFKIHSFLAMVHGAQCVGVPYQSAGQQLDFDIMSVEKWPIVQAYALEGIGGGGFFTMKHKVVDISSKLHHIYHHMDPVAMETLVTEQLPLFERQWDSMLTLCRMEGVLTEGRVCEPLSSYFSHGRVVTAKGGRSLTTRHPFVLFGSHTRKSDLENAQRSGISYNSDLQHTGVSGKHAYHMICQAVSPRGALCCTRTYFCDQPVDPLPMDGTSSRDPPNRMTDSRLVQEIYSAVVRAVMVAADFYSMTLDASKAEDTAIHTLLEECKKAELPLNPDLFTNRRYVEFSLSAYDSQNRVIPLKAGVSVPYVKTIRLTMYDIHSLETAGAELGSVSYGDSFMESSVRVLYPDESVELNSESVNLTQCLPQFISWPIHQRAVTSVREVQRHLSSADNDTHGRTLLGGHSGHVVCEGAPDRVYKSGELTIYERCVVFLHHHLGALVLPKHELAAVHFYDGDSPSVPALLILSYKERVRDYLPPPLHSATYRLILALQPRTKAYKAFFSQVLPVWRLESESPSLEMLDELPPELAHIHRQLEKEHQMSLTMPSNISALHRAHLKLPDLHNFLRHLAVSSVSDSAAVCSKHLPAVLGREYDSGSFTDRNEMILTVLSGVPGSHKDALCSTLTSLSRDEARWVVLRHSVTHSERYSRDTLQSSLAAGWRGQKRRHSGKRLRAVVVSPGFTDTADIVQAILSHPDPDVAAHVKIGAVTVCIDPANTMLQDSAYTLPKLLDQCAQGWVNNVVFTGPPASAQDPAQVVHLQRIQTLVRAINSDVALLLAPGGDMSRSTDIDLVLSETAFDADSMLRSRYLSCPGWWNGQFEAGPISPDMEENILSFYQPLEKHRLVNRLKALKTAHRKFPFAENIYHVKGRVQFTDSPQMFDLHYTALSDSLTLTPAELQPTPPKPPAPSANGHAAPPCCLLFIGCRLDKDKLRDWIRACVRPKPERRVYRTRASLTRTEVNRLHKEHHLAALPEGWFYNGSQFVSLAGDRSDTHPNLEEFLSAYIKRTNREVDTYNARLERTQYSDVFEE